MEAEQKQRQSPKYRELKYDQQFDYQPQIQAQIQTRHQMVESKKNNGHVGLIIPNSKHAESVELTSKDLINMEAIRNKQEKTQKEVK